MSAQEDVLVRLLTTRGDIVLALDVGRAPRSAGAFLDAVERGAFEGVAFTRVVRTDNDHGAPTIEVVQTLPSRTEGPPEAIPHEPTNETGLRHVAGAVSLARAAPGSATPTTFFICLSDQPALDHGGLRQPDGQGFAVFGQVVEGMDVAHEIQAGATTDAAPVPYLRGQLLAEPVAIVGARCEADSPLDRFDHLAADYWAFRAREFPHEATAAGDDRYNDRLGGIGLGDHARRARLASALLARARALQPSSLDRARRTSLDLLVGQLETLTEAWRLGDHLTPKLFPFGFTEIPAYLVRSTPLGSARDFEDLVARLRGIPAYLEGGRETLREGASRGYRLPRVLAARVRGLVEAQLAPTGLAASVRTRFAVCPPSIGEDRLAELSAAAEDALQCAALPALRALLDWLIDNEMELCRDTLSVCDQPDGRDYYRFKVRQQTTTDLDPDEIHDLGLAEVSRIRQAMAELLSEVGFGGDARAYGDQLAGAWVAPDAASLLERARIVAKTIDAELPRLFGRLPGITYGVRAFTREQSLHVPVAMAQAAPADRSLAGVFWLTALPERCPTYLLPTLCLHEAWPGHLMQFALGHELKHLPMFRRHSSFDYNAYIEGWALYCEGLGSDLGVFSEPEVRFGQLTSDLWRAARLVVDTGLHWKGWSRAAAAAYLEETALLPTDTVMAEIDRYIGMPAQALSYKIGELAIRSLRTDAVERLGEAFSLRDFHDAVLETGAVSLEVLRAHMAEWLAARCAAPPAIVGDA